ncbi:MAG: GGDEF domain-containing protein, partial [Deltaproteobacteria bacterium]|nr:GGDEF domain-containing protein [Deltaproteobacteria bacterium]
VVTVSYKLNGLGWRHILRQVVLPGFLGELAFTPLGFALALAYKDQDIRILGALGVSYITFNYIFKRMWVKSEAEGEQARELKLVEEVGRAAASTLDVEEMGRRIGMALVGALPGTAGVVLSVVPENGGGPLHFVRAGDRADKPAVLGAVLRVLAREADWAGEAARIATPVAPSPPLDEITVGQVLTCPLVAPNGTRRGFLSIALHAGTRPTEGHHRILASISRQAAIAVENWRLYSMATEDGLTGLYVRRYLETRLAEEFERATRSGSAFCLLLVDVDNLKVVNDLHGHGAGDTLLREVAAALRESIRGMDVACRWGGDEFAVLLPDMSLEDGFAVGQRLAEAVKARTFAVGGATVNPSASVGVAGHPTSGPRDPADLFAIADRALYAVKKSGRKGTVVAAEPRDS